MSVITNMHVYDLEETLVASGYAMINEYNTIDICKKLDDLRGTVYGPYAVEENAHVKRAMVLTKAPLNSGHCSFLKGIVVNMDLTFTNKVWIEIQRYHFADIITGMSTMHRLSRFDLESAFIDYVSPEIIEVMKRLQQDYNNNPTKENYLSLVYSCPSGLKMTGRVTTNYLQLMTIYKQRHNHRLPEWRTFCKECVDQLPFFEDFLIANGVEIK